jgi:hypothetical protein
MNKNTAKHKKMSTVLPDGITDLLVAQDVVRRRRLLDPVQLERGQLLHPGYDTILYKIS